MYNCKYHKEIPESAQLNFRIIYLIKSVQNQRILHDDDLVSCSYSCSTTLPQQDFFAMAAEVRPVMTIFLSLCLNLFQAHLDIRTIEIE